MITISKKKVLMNIGIAIFAFSALHLNVFAGPELKKIDNKKNTLKVTSTAETTKQNAYKDAEKVAKDARMKLEEQKKLEIKKININYDMEEQKIKHKLQDDKAAADTAYKTAIQNEQKSLKEAKEEATSKAEIEKAQSEVEKARIAAENAVKEAEKAKVEADKAKIDSDKAKLEADKASKAAAVEAEKAAAVPSITEPTAPAAAPTVGN